MAQRGPPRISICVTTIITQYCWVFGVQQLMTQKQHTTKKLSPLENAHSGTFLHLWLCLNQGTQYDSIHLPSTTVDRCSSSRPRVKFFSVLFMETSGFKLSIIWKHPWRKLLTWKSCLYIGSRYQLMIPQMMHTSLDNLGNSTPMQEWSVYKLGWNTIILTCHVSPATSQDVLSHYPFNDAAVLVPTTVQDTGVLKHPITHSLTKTWIASVLMAALCSYF